MLRFTAKRFSLLVGLSLGALTSAVAQQDLQRAAFKSAATFDEDFSYSAGSTPWLVAESEFNARWAAQNTYQAGNVDETQYFSYDALLLTGHSLKITVTKLSAQQQAEAHTANTQYPRPDPANAAAPQSPNGAAVAYQSCRLISASGTTFPDKSKGGFTGYGYGLYEFSCTFSRNANGIWPSLWMQGDGTEIDVLDNTTGDAHNYQVGVLDWKKLYDPDTKGGCVKTDAAGKPVLDAAGNRVIIPDCQWTGGTMTDRHGLDLSANFNTYSAVWTPQGVIFYLNGREMIVVPQSQVATHPVTARMFIGMATRGKASPGGNLEVDYVKYYEFADAKAQSKYHPKQGWKKP